MDTRGRREKRRFSPLKHMNQETGKLIIDKNGKLILTGEIFDNHGSYSFDAYVDTGSSFGLILTRELADAVCAKIEEKISNISIGGGSNSVIGHKRKANLRFGELTLSNYEITVVEGGTRNLVGIKFFQDTQILMLIDFKGKTSGGLITNDRRFASAIGKTAHFLTVHKTDITRSDEPCPICNDRGE